MYQSKVSVLFLSVHQTNQVTSKLQWTISSVFFSLSLRWAVKEAGDDIPSTPTPSLFSFPDFHLVFRKFSQLLSSFPLVREILSAVKMAAAAWGIFSIWQTPIHPPLSSSLFLCWRAIFCAGVSGGQKFLQHTPHFTNTVEANKR